uniref:Ras-like GTP-binding protein RHO n=1 Tax=Caligus clemensi TaxID=344056 RepID=C1C150_CALCM|nr:Ras-like GTP-binding protein RHO precursor [Caligus clemensi]ACO15642.1 Ras-like GTP-binding protein RHO precursor [Caligus clemensi]
MANKKLPIRRKLIVVGDGGSGKTCLLMVFLNREFPKQYLPTVFENYVTDVPMGRNKNVELSLWDTAGQEAYDRLRPLSYPESHVIVICYSVDSPGSLANALEKWSEEVSHFCPGVPIILVGNKLDLRPKETLKKSASFTTFEEGKAVAERINAHAFIECSSKDNIGVRDVFEVATRAALAKPKKKLMHHCAIL